MILMIEHNIHRDVEKAKRAVQEIKEETGHDVTIEPLDLSDVESVKKFAERCLKESRLDILVNNAGLMMPVRGLKTKQDFEVASQINIYLFHTHLFRSTWESTTLATTSLPASCTPSW